MKTTSRAGYYRVQATMPPELTEWLEKIGAKCKASGGYKLSKCEIIRSSLEALRYVENHLDVTEVRDEVELKKRILAAFEKRRATQ
jgi:hypothetical protein